MQEQQVVTPLMKQYYAIKQQYSDTLLLFQVGDFYELFFDDAKKASAALGITLTARGKNNGEPIPLCGVPVHALDYYLIKLVRAGFRIAICNQLEEATPGKVVERGVVKVLTPGTLTDDVLLDQKSASYLCIFVPLQHEWALLFGELLTAQLYATIISPDAQRTVENEIARFSPDEIILPSMANELSSYFGRLGYCTTTMQKGDDALVQQWLDKQFKKDFIAQCQNHEALRSACAYFYWYLHKNQKAALDQFKHISLYSPEEYLLLDSNTQRNLELVKNSYDATSAHTLFAVLDNAVTSMGSRMIKKWLLRPLVHEELITQRLAVVELFATQIHVQKRAYEILKNMGDIERIVGRVALQRASLHDYLSLKSALEVIPNLYTLIAEHTTLALMHTFAATAYPFESLRNLLDAALNSDATRDWTINSGFDQRLDHVRELVEHSNQLLLALEKKEQEKTGISSLKVRYNQVHGYYIEVTKPNIHLVPEYYIRHQTLVGKERFTTTELKSLEQEIVTVRNEIEHIEREVFERIKAEVALHVSQLRKTAHVCAYIDGLLGLALTAYNNNYVRPQFNHEGRIAITGGRHPVVEQSLKHAFIANDTLLREEQRLSVVTGPNMGGKSTYLRQVALISIMAQAGSFVPAKVANLALLDRIFTRIGAGDNVAHGKSTFLVEMEETALICAHATEKSLVILDEVGRGTSTFDGLAIAQAVIEFLYVHVRARCLFATHYHELTALTTTYSGIGNLYAASKKTPTGVLLLYKIIEGIADGSFGIEVAKMAQLPSTIIVRAQEILDDLNHKAPVQENVCIPAKKDEEVALLSQKVKQQDELLQTLRTLDYNTLSPKQAFDLLWSFKEEMQ